MSVWSLERVTKSWRRGFWGTDLSVGLRGASLEVAAGERVAVIGESGSGKSTLARVGLGLLPADAGTIRLFGEDTAGWTARRWRLARGKAQLLFQDAAASLHPSIRVVDLLVESARLHRPEAKPTDEARRALAAVGLSDRADAWPSQLSGGEQRRVTIARLLLARPQLVVADEPTAGLDAALKADLLDLLLRSLGPRCAVVLISHDLSLVSWCCQRAVVLDAGAIVEKLPMEALDRAAHPSTRALLDAAGLPLARQEAR